jgi:large subunit ribosomal protein L15
MIVTQPDNLKGSGLESVLATCIFAIIGVVSLQHGANFASKLARERVIRRLKQ